MNLNRCAEMGWLGCRSFLLAAAAAIRIIFSSWIISPAGAFPPFPLTPLSSVSTRSFPFPPLAAMPASEQERLLLTGPAQTAFIVAEMRSFLSSTLERNDGPSGHLYRREMSTKDKIAANLIDLDGNVINEEYQEAKRAYMSVKEVIRKQSQSPLQYDILYIQGRLHKSTRPTVRVRFGNMLLSRCIPHSIQFSRV